MLNKAELDTALSWARNRLFFDMTFPVYIKGLLTPFNIILGFLTATGLSLIVVRLIFGLGAVTSASQDQPWGLFLSWGLFSGVPLSATGFVLGTAVYILGLKEYRPVVKNAMLIGFLGYLFAVIFLIIDLGRPWRLTYPMFGAFGTASVLFLVAWHVALYLSCQFLELSPSIIEWGGWESLHKPAVQMTVVLTILGAILSTLHQSALGALLLLAPAKLHPLWYSPYLPVLFFISAIAAGICMVIFVTALTKRFFKAATDSDYLAKVDDITLRLGKGASFVLLTYIALKFVALAHGNNWDLLTTPYGIWFLVELSIFLVLPWEILVYAIKKNRVGLVQFAAVFTLIGIILNRFNVSMIALNWQLPEKEFFAWRELLIVVGVVAIEILVYRWIVNRLPILRGHPE